MDNNQKIEQIVNKTNCSYEDAEAALESCGWDTLDAVISLERDGKVKKEMAEPSDPKSGASVRAEQEEEIVEIIPEVYAEDFSEKDSAKDAKGGKKHRHGLLKRIKSILMNNRMVILRKSGQLLANFPIIIPIIALLVFFWATVVMAVIAMVFGFRFHFEGEDLGKTNINNTMDKATDFAEKVKEDLTKKANE